MNGLLEAETVDEGALKEAMTRFSWEKVLWETRATQEITTSCTLNEMHLLFLLIARARAVLCPTPRHKIGALLQTPSAELLPKLVSELSLRELSDTVQNMQSLWGTLIEEEDPADLFRALDACMTRFGALARGVHPETVLDCEDMVEEDGTRGRWLSNACIRTFSAFFFVAYRHAHLAAACFELGPAESLTFEVHSHLVTASLDDFYRQSMYFDMPMAAILQYRHEFTGMFHSVTQVMYYNNPAYARRKQKGVDGVVSAESPEYMLPVMQQIHPNVPVLYEDDPLPPAFAVPGSADLWDPDEQLPSDPASWAWIFLPGRLYLACRTGHLFRSTHPAALCNLLDERVK